MKVVSEKLVSLPEALALLQKRQKEGELSYEQQNTLAYLQEFACLSAKDADSLKKELKELGFLNEFQIISLTNLLPKNEDEVKLILGGDRTGSSEQVKKVLEIVKRYKPSKK